MSCRRRATHEESSSKDEPPVTCYKELPVQRNTEYANKDPHIPKWHNLMG